MTRQEIIKAIETCYEVGSDCAECPLYFEDECNNKLGREVITLMKEQEAVEPYMDFDGHDVWRCGKCGATIFHIYHNASDEDAKNYAKFCRHCGREVKWE